MTRSGPAPVSRYLFPVLTGLLLKTGNDDELRRRAYGGRFYLEHSAGSAICGPLSRSGPVSVIGDVDGHRFPRHPIDMLMSRGQQAYLVLRVRRHSDIDHQ